MFTGQAIYLHYMLAAVKLLKSDIHEFVKKSCAFVFCVVLILSFLVLLPVRTFILFLIIINRASLEKLSARGPPIIDDYLKFPKLSFMHINENEYG